jgi:hypothetical protein
VIDKKIRFTSHVCFYDLYVVSDFIMCFSSFYTLPSEMSTAILLGEWFYRFPLHVISSFLL